MQGIQRLIPVTLAFLLVAGLSTACKKDKVDQDICFESDVLPVFRSHCSTSGCHNAVDRKKGYDLTNYNGIMRGIRPESVKSSKLLKAINNVDGVAMPPANYPQPSAEQIETIEAWVKAGAENTSDCAVSACDGAAPVGFTADIQPLLNTNCIGCHSGSNPNGGLDLTSFNVLHDAALDGRLLGVIKAAPGFTAMPPNSSLASCDIAQIEKWVAEGAQEN